MILSLFLSLGACRSPVGDEAKLADATPPQSPAAHVTSIKTAATLLAFNASLKGVTPGASRLLTIRNDDSAPFAVDATMLKVTGADATQFVFAPSLKWPFVIAPGASVDVPIDFKPTSVGIKDAHLVLQNVGTTSPTLDVRLRGIGMPGLEGGNEPSLQRIFDTYLLSLKVGTSNSNVGVLDFPPLKPNDEIPMQQLKAASAAPIQVEAIAVFGPGTKPVVTMGFYPIKTPTSRTAVFEVPQGHNQTLSPRLPANLTFNPGSTPFGIYATFPNFNTPQGQRFTTSEDALNTWDKDPNHRHKFRFYPLKEPNGQAVPNAVVVAIETVDGNRNDYQDLILILRNVTAK